MSDLIVLLPARDEEDGIGEVIDRIPIPSISEMGYDTRVIVVDGHSTDSTREIAQAKGAELIRQKSPQGKGLGVREALRLILNGRESNEDLIVMLDADATYSPEDLPRFVEMLQTNEVVWGSRMRGRIEKDAMSRTNRLGNNILSFCASILFMKRTTDLCTGYWGFRSGSLAEISLRAEGFTLEANLFGSVAKSNLKTCEIPIDYAHREGTSTLTWYHDGPRILFMSLKKKFEYRRKPVHDLLFIFAFAVTIWLML